ncbi:Uncharacterised protein [Acinetobacter baumannii]|nr:Uncharacterised protein [Acinetobacter baumannii]SSU20613.1 Uncharacterised protein [Acinetobacter baumannii]
MPSAGATTFWPIGAGMSRPECGARSSPLKKRFLPKELVNLPEVGRINFGKACHELCVNEL